MKKATSVFAVALLFMSLLSTIPIVNADITLTSEFVQPVKNCSFEDRDMPDPYVPNEGVYRCPPWETNNGGWRHLRGDVNNGGDGKVDMEDISIISRAFGSYPSHPRWNPDADLNGDAKVNIMDASTAAIEFGEYTNCIDGSYSWYTSGGGDYQMWQWLDSDIVNVVKGRQVAFAFSFLPESVAADGSQNYARAEIYYEYDGGSNTVYGDLVHPTELKWYPAYVTATIPSGADLVKVVIHGEPDFKDGEPDFKAWIDQASLSITETKLATETWSDLGMTMKLAVNLFEFKDYETPIDPFKAFLGIGMSAQIDKSESWFHVYFIEYVELKVRLIGGSYVRITNVTQSNDVDYKTDPDQSQKLENWYTQARNIAIKGILTLGVFLVNPSVTYNIGKLLLSGTAFVAGTVLLKTYRSDADDDYTDNPDVPAKARINYIYATDFVRFASEGAIVEAGSETGSSQIEVTAKARVSAIDKYSGLIVHIRDLEKTISVTVSL